MKNLSQRYLKHFAKNKKRSNTNQNLKRKPSHKINDKKILLSCTFMVFYFSVSGQWNSTGFNYTTDRLGIGTNAWSGKRLNVQSNDADHMCLMENSNSSGFGLLLRAANDPLRILPFSGSGNYLFVVNSNGNVGIGTTNTGSYKLAVEGKVGAREFNITEANPWPDYVFEKNYNLPTLFELETFINQNKHLPEVPDACTVKENGINLGEINVLLMKKIEELTLYMIEMKKENEAQQKEIDQLKKKK